MLNIRKMAQVLNMKESTFGYWLKKNETEYNSNLTNIKLSDYYTKNGRNVIFPNIEEFIAMFNEYQKFAQLKKMKKKRSTKFFWTNASLECYTLKGNCKSCSNNFFCKDFENPPIKRVVQELLDNIGEPNEHF